jgi:hypothetical protein
VKKGSTLLSHTKTQTEPLSLTTDCLFLTNYSITAKHIPKPIMAKLTTMKIPTKSSIIRMEQPSEVIVDEKSFLSADDFDHLSLEDSYYLARTRGIKTDSKENDDWSLSSIDSIDSLLICQNRGLSHSIWHIQKNENDFEEDLRYEFVYDIPLKSDTHEPNKINEEIARRRKKTSHHNGNGMELPKPKLPKQRTRRISVYLQNKE